MAKNSSWKLCMKIWHVRSMCLWIFSIFLLILFAFPMVLAAMEGDAVSLGIAIGLAILGIGQLLCSFFMFGIERRKYQMSEEGITILYYGRMQKFYPWSAFRKIVVCDVNHATKFPEICEMVIRLSAMDEPDGPHSKKQKRNLTGIASWRKYGYFVRNFSNILLLDYSPELLDELVRVSGLPFTFSLTSYGKAKLESIREMGNDK